MFPGGSVESEKIGGKGLIWTVYGRFCQRCCVITFRWEQVIQNLTGLDFVSIAAADVEAFQRFDRTMAHQLFERMDGCAGIGEILSVGLTQTVSGLLLLGSGKRSALM